MTHRRRREVERMITDLGLVIGGFRTNGNSHWRVDVLTPDRQHQRPFTFPTSGHDGPRRFDEINMIKRWRRQVAPELEVAEEAGTLRPGVKTGLAEKLEELGIPLKRETDGGMMSPPIGASVLKPQARIEPPPFQKKRYPLTPLQALTEACADAPDATPKTPKTTTPIVIPKEPVMQAQTTLTRPERPAASTVNGGHAKKGAKNNFLGRAGDIKLADWLRVPGRLDGPTNSLLLAEAASKELGLTITHSNVLGMLRDLGLEIKQQARRATESGKHTTRLEYLAAVLIDVLEHSGATVPEELLKIAVNEKDIRLRDAPMPRWRSQA